MPPDDKDKDKNKQVAREADEKRRESEKDDPAAKVLAGTESERRQQADIPEDNLGSSLTSVPYSTSAPLLDSELIAKANQAAQEAYNQVIEEGLSEKSAGDDTVFEVMVDTWGHSPQFVRGTFIKRGDVPYDIDQAERMGTVRRAPEYQHSQVPHATMPLEMGSGGSRIDYDQQQSARAASGAQAEEGIRSTAATRESDNK